jgi:hypothetical protein
MRSIVQPGPPAPERIQWVAARGRAFSFTLEAGVPLLEAARRGFAAEGFAGGTLSMKDGAAQFMARLVREQLSKQRADALIIVGPKASGDVKISRETMDSVETLDRPIFYLNYNTDPFANPWRDFIGNVVKRKRGFEYSITHPKDLFNAWSDVVSRIVRVRHSNTVDKTTAKGL